MAHWKQRETVFGEYELALTLPGRWQLRPSESPTRWLYRSSEKHKEHVTLIREESQVASGNEEAELRRIVARQRRAMELGFGHAADLVMSDPEQGERFGKRVVQYRGAARGLDHYFAVIFVWQERTVWTLVYDAFRLTEAQAREQAETIFASIVLRGAS